MPGRARSSRCRPLLLGRTSYWLQQFGRVGCLQVVTTNAGARRSRPYAVGIGVGMTETGTVAGFDDAYLELYDSLMRTALLLVGSMGHAEDLVQDAFARAFPKWDTIENPKAYLTAAVTNGARNTYRGRDAAARLNDPPAAGAPDSNRDLHDSLLRLPYRQRAVVVLRYYVGLDDPAIARALGCTRSTVRSSARRGLQQLRKDVQP